MTLIEFSNYAFERAEEYGIKRYNVSIMACNHGLHDKNEISYTIQAWDSKAKTHIRANQPNPSSALSEFAIKLNAHFKDYSKKVEDIDL